MEDTCICCGAIIPEGVMVCPNCLLCVKQEDDNENHKVSESCV